MSMIHSPRSSEPVVAAQAPTADPKLYHCGPLTYTKMGLTVLFAWLLWGDFCFTLMEAVVPSILPVKLKAFGTSNTTMSLILSVLPGIMNMTICPWVSSSSDRYRSKWGRRIPFILWTMPFLVLALIGLGFSDSFYTTFNITTAAEWLHVHPMTATVGLIGFFMTAFAFFNMFVGSVFWYLFNDVVPPQFLGRFMGLFRLVGTAASAIYNYYIFQYAETHTREIMIGAALIYFVGFGLMCLRVKEGPYPPPPDDATSQGLRPMVRAFVTQSFSARFYWYFYLMQTFWVASAACNLFLIFFNQEMGLSLQQFGQMTAYGSIAMLAATWFTAVFVDRWHPLRVKTYLCVFAATTGFGGWVWVTMTLPPEVFFWLSVGGLLVTRFSFTLGEACAIPIFMRLMPKSLYGQFSSANALVRTAGGILAGLLAGLCMDSLMWYYDGSDFAYRWIWIWPWFFGIGSAIFVCLGYREWKRLGGDDHYRPPAPWKPEGFEEVADTVKSVPAQPRTVMISMWLGVIAIVVNLLLVPIFLHFMHTHGMDGAVTWYLWYFLPIKIGLLACAYLQLVHVRRDIAAQERGLVTRYGVPHHGVMLVNAIQGLVYFPLYWYQTIKMIELGLGDEQILFGVANLLSTAGTIIGVHVIRWVERPLTVPVAAEQPPLPSAAPASPATAGGANVG